MATYYFIKNYKNYGKLAINRNVFKDIAVEAVSNISGASLKTKNGSKSKRKSFKLTEESIDVTFHSNGQIEMKVAIALSKSANPEKVCLAIQEAVSNSIIQYTESVPLTVTINITSII